MIVAVVADPALHARWLNTFSYREFVGFRKIVKSQRAEVLTAAIPGHACEGGRHALGLKKLAIILGGAQFDSYAPEALLCGEEAAAYFQDLDKTCDAAFADRSGEERAKLWLGLNPGTAIQTRGFRAWMPGARPGMIVWTAPPRRHLKCQSVVAGAPQRGKEFIRIGVDLGKNYFQVHALESADGRTLTRKLRRAESRAFFANAKPCVAGMEACGSAPLSQTKGLGARTASDGSRGAFDPADLRQALRQARQERRRRRGRDRAEAMSRPGMRFVPAKSEEQQATLM